MSLQNHVVMQITFFDTGRPPTGHKKIKSHKNCTPVINSYFGLKRSFYFTGIKIWKTGILSQFEKGNKFDHFVVTRVVTYAFSVLFVIDGRISTSSTIKVFQNLHYTIPRMLAAFFK